MLKHSKLTPVDAHYITARFLLETSHLGEEGQKRVLEAIKAANRSRKARLQAQAVIDKAKQS